MNFAVIDPAESQLNLFVKIVNSFQQKATSYMFDWVLNKPLAMVANTIV